MGEMGGGGAEVCGGEGESVDVVLRCGGGYDSTLSVAVWMDGYGILVWIGGRVGLGHGPEPRLGRWVWVCRYLASSSQPER